MPAATNKTIPTDENVQAFLNQTEDDQNRQDCQTILDMMSRITGQPPKMWGTSIIGFGSYHYKYESGREGDAAVAGFSPRKQNITIYIVPGYDKIEHLLTKLGKYKIGKSCLYLKRLADVDEQVLSDIITYGVEYVKQHYPTV